MILSTISLISSFPALAPRYRQSFPFAGRSFCCWKTRYGNDFLSFNFRRAFPRSKAKTEVYSAKEEEEEDFRVLTTVRSNFNEIMILETSKARLLLLDSSHNVHSIFNKGESKWTNSYWDEFASLPPIVPKGPIAIFGLGGGTAADLMLQFWPSLQIEGWEIDEILIHKAREYLGLADLEKCTEAGGVVKVRIGDALSPSSTIAGGYAGIIVDLFSEGSVLPQLEEVKTWVEIREKLMSNGRIMVNCGGISDKGSLDWEQNYAIRALNKAFPGELYWKEMPKEKGANFLALTGPLPDLSTWSSALPHELSSSVLEWRSCLPS